MSQSNTLREIFVEETVVGVTPVDSPNWKDYPISGSGGISARPQTVQSTRVRDDRGTNAPSVVGFDVDGSYAPAAFKEDQVDPIISSVLMSDWVAGVVANGDTLKTFSWERQFGDLTDKYLQYKGVAVDTMNLDFANVRDKVMFSTTMIGMTHDNDETVSLVGAGSVLPESSNRELTALDVNNVTLGGTTGFCISTGTLAISNGLYAQFCAGEANGNASDIKLGTFSVSGSLAIVCTDAAWAFLQSRDTQAPIALAFDIAGDTATYSFDIPQTHLSFDDPASAGADQIINLDISMQASQVIGGYTIQVTKV